MKKFIVIAACGAMMASCAAQTEAGEARIVMPEKEAPSTIVVSSALLKNLLNARSEADLNLRRDTLQVKGGVAEMQLKPEGPARYSVEFGPRQTGDFYASPGENILMQVSSISPLSYVVEGTPLMEGLTEIAAKTTPIETEYYRIANSGVATREQVQPLMEAYDKAILDFIAANPKSPAVAFAMLDLDGKPFMETYDKLTPEARESIFMPFLEKRVAKVKAGIQAEEQRASMLAGDKPAPDFTFKDLDGKNVSLSDFRGKWVVIDFWGSWCGWCIKGFPKLKEAYKEYGDKLVILGVDCNDSPEAWREAVKRFELPWVNVYNDQQDGALLKAYGVQGFPTKGIVNPEGKLVDLTTGEDPSFFTRLAGFINGK